MADVLTLRYPERKAEIIAFCRKHHYPHRCPAVWGTVYALQSHRGAIRAVAIYGEPPYPSVRKAFCRRPEDHAHLAWPSAAATTAPKRSCSGSENSTTRTQPGSSPDLHRRP